MLLQRGLRLQRLVCGRRLFAVTRWYSQRTASAGLSAGGGVGSVAACRPPPLGCAAAAPALHPTGRRCCTAAAASSHAPDRGGAGDAPSAEIPAADEPFSFCVEHGQLGGKAKARLDAYLAAVLPDASRAKIAASVKAGRVSVNGAACAKPSAALRAGDRVGGSLLPPEPCTAEPESIPLAIVYEDDAVIVVNKAPGMVVHLSPGHARGTLVNALLAHCGLPSMSVPSGSARAGGGGLIGGGGEEGADDDDPLLPEDGDDEDVLEGGSPPPLNAAAGPAAASGAAAAPPQQQAGGGQQQRSAPPAGVLRPGIVHRLDKGTSGLLVVAKNDTAHARLCDQFKARTVSRVYRSITLGTPSPASGRVATNIARDPADRLRMAAAGYGAARGRPAASNYRVVARIGGGAAALVEWKLGTGRTHQIRVHAKHIGHPLLGDDAYSPGNAAAARALAGRRASLAPAARAALDALGRPALHALTLGFDHPLTGRRLHFEAPMPRDLERLAADLEALLAPQTAPHGEAHGGGGGSGGGGSW